MDFKRELHNRVDYIDKKIKKFMPLENGPSKTVLEAMNYSFNAGGKRLRPILLMESFKICNGRGDDYLAYASAIEMIHTYSLIHDDLPPLDNDDLRRGLPTNHVKYGEAMAILAGDGLLSNAFETMLFYSLNLKNPYLGLRASYEISRGAGINGMLSGQVVDIESEGKKEKISLQTLEYIHMNKTAAMIIASVRAGAILADCSDEMLEKLTTYAESIGLSFQIVDDILDIEGDEKLLGKHVGSDIENDKSTYPSLVGLDRSKEIARELVERAKRSIKDIEGSEFLIGLSDYIYSRKK